MISISKCYALSLENVVYLDDFFLFAKTTCLILPIKKVCKVINKFKYADWDKKKIQKVIYDDVL